VKNDDRDYILVEDVAMDGPVKLVLESSPVKDPNPLPLRCSPSEVPCCGGHAHLSLSLSLSRLLALLSHRLLAHQQVGFVKLSSDTRTTPFPRVPVGFVIGPIGLLCGWVKIQRKQTVAH
jgi:hypothetical protein